MTVREKIFGAVGIVLVVLLIFAGRVWLEERDARVKAEAVQSAQQQVIDQAQKSIDAAKVDQAKQASDLQARLDAIEKQKQQPVTAPQFVVDLNKLIPNLPQPATVIPAQPEMKTANGETKPAVAETVQIPAADLPALRDYKLSCDETSAKLNACQLTNADVQAELAGTQTQLTATAKERDAYKAAAKGGSFLHRLGKDVKCLAVSGGLAAAGAYADKNQPERGAVIGVVVGGVGCRMF